MNDDGLTSETYCSRLDQERGGENALHGEKFTSRDCAKFGAAANFTPEREKKGGRVRRSVCLPYVDGGGGDGDGDGWMASPERMFGKLPTVAGLHN